MDNDRDAAESASHALGIDRCYYREDDLLRDADVEAVYIATPTFLHAGQVSAAAKRGKHILCEKPLAMTSKECYELSDLCRQAGVKLGVGFMMRYHGAHRRIKSLLDQGALGQIVSARAQLTCWYPPLPGAWRQRWATAAGGALVDMGIHCVDLLRCLLGEVRQVTALVETQTHAYEVDDSATLLLKFQNGAHGVVEAFFNVPDAGAVNALELYGTRGTILGRGTIGQSAGGELQGYLSSDADNPAGYDALQTRDYKQTIGPLHFDQVNAYRAEIEQFAQWVLYNNGEVVNAEEAARDLAVVEAGYVAAREGRVVTL